MSADPGFDRQTIERFRSDANKAIDIAIENSQTRPPIKSDDYREGLRQARFIVNWIADNPE